MVDLDTGSRKEQRTFGLAMAGAIAALGLVRWGLHWVRSGVRPTPPWCFVAVAAAFLVFALLWPRALKPIFVVWMKLTYLLNWIMTHTVLTVAFVVLFIPGALILRLTGRDPLKRGWDKKAPTYWEEAEPQPEEFERYLDQF